MPIADDLALRAAVLADPADDTPRLVLADWLEEHGDAERAAFVRRGVELSALVADPLSYDTGRPFALAAEQAAVPTETLLAWLRRDGAPAPPDGALVVRISFSDVEAVRDVRAEARLGFRRGFVAEVTCPPGWWLAHGPALVAVAPVTDVGFVRVAPARGPNRRWVWRRPESAVGGTARNDLPFDLFERLPGRRSFTAEYPSHTAAMAALSAACLLYARGRPCASG